MSTTAEALMLDAIRKTLRRDIAALGREVEAYPDDATLWVVVPGISNSGGTLALHIAGNLRHFIGAALGNSGYVRNRDAEFSDRDAPRVAVAEQLADAGRVVEAVLRDFDVSRLGEQFPVALPGGMPAKIGPFLMQNVVPRLSETPGEVRWTGPKLGEHNDEVFKEVLEMTEEDLDGLRERGIV